MRPISLNIGPSEISAHVTRDLVEIAESGLLSESHRGARVKDVLLAAVAHLRSGLRIPDEYGVCFQPSATASMELVLRNCVRRQGFHVVQGAFAARFATTADEVGLQAARHELPWEATIDPRDLRIPTDAELIAITHNETSTGRAWPWEAIDAVRARHPEALLALDVTSSIGGLHMDWRRADLWFGSVQKCLGLPAGLGLVIASPRALERARAIGAARHVAGWQDLPALIEKLGTGQTPETPNVLGIALLGRQMARWDLDAVDAATRAKAAAVAAAAPDEAFFVREPDWRSLTTHCLRVDDPAACKARAEAAGFVLGSGYGALKPTCIRIATFPAVPLEKLRAALHAVTVAE